MPREARPERLEEPYWRSRSVALSRMAAGDLSRVNLVFLGDSITENWDRRDWEANYGRYGALNLGVSGDFVQGLLWRLTAGGQWPSTLRPRLAVLLIGTNNASYNSPPESTALGIAEVLREVRRRSPETRILLLGILPRGAEANDPGRRLNAQVNELIARCADGRSVFYLDAGPALVDAQGRLAPSIAPDRLHLSAEGYARLSAAIEPSLRAILTP
ncbi:GDSL family lipase [Roseomonas sp. KE2513]|uniref:GDSL-type esterase/lipase family protein n=1 Tax=Roseomonas sp. KE2513 TaxID=2479202 RepID=UPI0018DF03C1|nr:GDSL-type esterase/lipase family protein [Roseomonas sp. KE2513]MBI0537651.1 GDSL family lipase [Roseomonas sp. KE2513]